MRCFAGQPRQRPTCRWRLSCRRLAYRCCLIRPAECCGPSRPTTACRVHSFFLVSGLDGRGSGRHCRVRPSMSWLMDLPVCQRLLVLRCVADRWSRAYRCSSGYFAPTACRWLGAVLPTYHLRHRLYCSHRPSHLRHAAETVFDGYHSRIGTVDADRLHTAELCRLVLCRSWSFLCRRRCYWLYSSQSCRRCQYRRACTDRVLPATRGSLGLLDILP